MKKILSISAIGLTVACCTSAAVFAANNVLSNEKKAIIQGMLKTYSVGGNPINNLAANENTKISDFFNENSDYYKKIEGKLKSYKDGKLLVDSINNGASIDEILQSSLIYASLNKDNFNEYKAMVNDISKELVDIDETTDSAIRVAKEQKVADMIDASYGTIKFGKNSDGNTTVSLDKNNQIIFQINTATANNLVDILNSFNSYDELKNYMKDLVIN